MKAIEIKGQILEVDDEIANVYNHFSTKTDTVYIHEGATDLIVKLFAITYIKDIADYYTSDRISRSNLDAAYSHNFFQNLPTAKFFM